MDNAQAVQMLAYLDNTCTALSNISYQQDLILGAIFAVVIAAAYRWHL